MTEIKHYGHIDPEVRLEMLVGHMSDTLASVPKLVEGLKLRSNAAHTSRSSLEMLREYAGMIFFELQAIKEEAQLIRAALGKAPPEPHEMQPRISQVEGSE